MIIVRKIEREKLSNSLKMTSFVPLFDWLSAYKNIYLVIIPFSIYFFTTPAKLPAKLPATKSFSLVSKSGTKKYIIFASHIYWVNTTNTPTTVISQVHKKNCPVYCFFCLQDTQTHYPSLLRHHRHGPCQSQFYAVLPVLSLNVMERGYHNVI